MVWKAAILSDMVPRFGGVTPLSVIGEFRTRGWITEEFANSSQHQDSLLVDANLPKGGAERAVVRFLRSLAVKGVVEDTGWAWKQTQRRSAELHQRRIEQDRADREAAQIAARLTSLSDLGKSIALLGCDIEQQSFDVVSWMQHAPDAQQSLKQIAIKGDAAWLTLKRALENTLAVLKDECEQEADDLGLPIHGALETMRAVHESRAAQRKAEAEEAERLRRLERLNTITALSIALIGSAHSKWLETPQSNLDGVSPREAAARSAGHLEIATRLLRRFEAHSWSRRQHG